MTSKEEFIAKIEGIYGIYRDCGHSFDLALRDLTVQQSSRLIEFNAKGQNWTIDDLDNKNLHYAVKEEDGKVNSAAAVTQGEWKVKIGKNGTNIKLIGNMCLVMIYQYSKGIGKDELASDLFGDLRHFRRSIIHNNGYAISEVDRCKILKWFRANDEIIIDGARMDQLIRLLKKEVSVL